MATCQSFSPWSDEPTVEPVDLRQGLHRLYRISPSTRSLEKPPVWSWQVTDSLTIWFEEHAYGNPRRVFSYDSLKRLTEISGTKLLPGTFQIIIRYPETGVMQLEHYGGFPYKCIMEFDDQRRILSSFGQSKTGESFRRWFYHPSDSCLIVSIYDYRAVQDSFILATKYRSLDGGRTLALYYDWDGRLDGRQEDLVLCDTIRRISKYNARRLYRRTFEVDGGYNCASINPRTLRRELRRRYGLRRKDDVILNCVTEN